ncbi:uncharacterized protein LOC129908605 isoform X2 [Episyrphus balteatus]|nr:uncharacterized protein LOC129908605 isoform X2 [Episyrphus balteatus]
MLDVDVQKLGQWLKKIYPLVEEELLKGPTPLSNEQILNSNDIEDELVIQPYQKISMHTKENNQGLATWLSIYTNNTPALVISTSAAHDDWCEHVDQSIKVFIPKRMSAGKFVVFQELKSIPTKACLETLSTNPFDKDLFAGSTVSEDLYIWKFISNKEQGDIEELFCENLQHGSVVGFDWPSNDRVLTCHANGWVCLWLIGKHFLKEREFLVKNPRHGNMELTTIVSISVTDFVVGCTDGALYHCSSTNIRAHQTEIEIVPMKSHKFAVTSLFKKMMKGNRIVISCDLSGEVYFHDIFCSDDDGRKAILRIPLPFQNSIACTKDASLIYCPGVDGSLKIYSVLLFPPVNNYRRFLIHQSCENYRENFDLFTFSVGQGPHRRTVICFKTQLLDPIKFTAASNSETKKPVRIKSWRSGGEKIECATAPSFWSLPPPSSTLYTKTTKRDIVPATTTTTTFNSSSSISMGVEKHLDSSSSSASARLNKSHSVDIYRPPALRRNYESIDNENHYLPQHQQQPQQQQHQKEEQQNPQLLPLQPNDKNCISANSLPTAAIIQPIAQNGCNGIDTEITTSTETTTTSTACSNQQRQVRRERRPDRAVYVPRARRSQTTPPAVTTQQQLQQQQQQQTPLNQEALPVTEHNNQLTSLTSPSSSLLSGGTTSTTTTTTTTTINATARTCKSPAGEKSSGSSSRRSNKDRVSSGRNKEKSLSSSKRISPTDDNNDRNNSHKIKNSNSNNNNNYHNSEEECLLPSSFTVRDQRKQQHRVEKPATAISAAVIGVNSGCRNSVNSNELSNCNDKNALLVKDCDISNNPKEFSNSTNSRMMQNNCNKKSGGGGVIVNTSGASDIKKVLKKINKTTSVSVQQPVLLTENVGNLRIEDAMLGERGRSDKCDRDAEELLRASKEINRSNRRIMKQTFNSDVLEIPDKVVLKPSVGHGRRFPKDDCKNVSAITSGSDDNEEDDWDSMYDDSGDCLDPKIIQELTASVGKVKIEMPKMDYSAYLTKQSILNDEEFPHVLEVSNFPMEFKNQDLLMVFSQYKESGFEIKWVDDTHALAVFSSSQVAAEVLAMGHPFVVLKPLAEATVESRLKAKKCSASLQPYKPRPETCAALARRLVTGALGVRLKTAPQERENEKRVLREAKERKLLAAKQRDEAWES